MRGCLCRKGKCLFQSTLPTGGATGFTIAQQLVAKISIHAPRGGSDQTMSKSPFSYGYFNSRSPWGERHLLYRYYFVHTEFQSTLPVGGATPVIVAETTRRGISIHAPRGGSDVRSQTIVRGTGHFNPRSPWGERLRGIRGHICAAGFQSTLPVGGATRPHPKNSTGMTISIHAPRGGSDVAGSHHHLPL